MIKRIFLLTLTLLIAFSLNAFSFGFPGDTQNQDYLKLLKDKMPFISDMSVDQIRKNSDGSIQINMKSEGDTYKTLDAVLDNNGNIKSVDYYVDQMKYLFGKSSESKISRDEAIIIGKKLLENVFGEKFDYVSEINDSMYIDDVLERPIIYKFRYKNLVDDIPVYNIDAYVYIDSESGDILKLKGQRVDELSFDKNIKMIDNVGALNVFNSKFNPILVYLKNNNDNFPKYRLYYALSIDYNLVGIDAVNGDLADFNGNMLYDDVLKIKCDANDFKKSYSIVANDEALKIAMNELNNFHIKDIKVLDSKTIERYFLTKRETYTFNMNHTDKSLIANANIAVDKETGNIISENVDISDDDGLFDTYGNLDRIIGFTKEILREKDCNLDLLKKPAIEDDDYTYVFYRVYNGAIVLDNYVRIKTDKNGKIINVSLNWDEADKPSKADILNESIARNILIDEKPSLYYLYTSKYGLMPIYRLPTMDLIVDALTKQKISINEFEKGY
ncbi:peptidase propeptide domain-containing protein [Thermoanaerobacterium thermosulfurigenes]|uniref:peptidase propeptide domain-containing protein n=1 Tax=Thermoanaerobacterium thermosulfurigenes TaxID=33950 RepID=UPI003EF35250